jgi:hypothetical protein
MSWRPLSPSDLVNAFQNLIMLTTSRINLANGAEAMGMAQASIKVKAPDAYHGERSKLRAFIS